MPDDLPLSNTPTPTDLKAALEVRKLQAEIAKLNKETEVLNGKWRAHAPTLAPILQAFAVIVVAVVGFLSARETNFFSTKRERAEIETYRAQQAATEARQTLSDLNSRKLDLSRENATLQQRNNVLVKNAHDLAVALQQNSALTSELRNENALNSIARLQIQKRLGVSDAKVKDFTAKVEATSQGRWNPNDVINLRFVSIHPREDYTIPLTTVQIIDEHRKAPLALVTDGNGVAKFVLTEADVEPKLLRLAFRITGLPEAAAAIPQGTINFTVRLPMPAPHLIQSRNR
jgi:hypothetical protein